MDITAVSMKLIGREKVRAQASIKIDGRYVVDNIRIIDSQKGLFVAIPMRMTDSGRRRGVSHPIKQDVRDMLETAVIEEYEGRLIEERT